MHQVQSILGNKDILKDGEMQEINRPISIKEVEKALHNLNGQSSPGLPLDSAYLPTPTCLIKEAATELTKPLHTLFNIMWSKGEYPTSLKRDKKIFIPKPNKDDYSNPKSYRMLTLMNWLAKLYDFIIADRFSLWLEQINFDNDQYAYRKKTSCNHALFYLSQNIIEGFNNNEATVALFVDLEGAFDAVWHQGLIYQLYQEGIRGNFLQITWNLLKERMALCEVNGKQEQIQCSETGTCQGSYSAAYYFTFFSSYEK